MAKIRETAVSSAIILMAQCVLEYISEVAFRDFSRWCWLPAYGASMGVVWIDRIRLPMENLRAEFSVEL